MGFWGLFSQKKPSLHAVIDVGSHAIKAVLFETRSSDRDRGGINAIRVLEKKVIRLSLQSGVLRGILEVRKLLWDTVKHTERIPVKISVGLGSRVGKLFFATWTARPVGRGSPSAARPARPFLGISRLDRKTVNSYFENLVEQHRHSGDTFIVHPVRILVNRYPVTTDSDIFTGDLKELQFRVLLLVFSAEVGRVLADIKRSLGGMPVEFVPLAAALEEAFSHDMGKRDMILADIGGEETELILMREGSISAYTSFSYGAQNFVRGVARNASLPFHEAEDLIRQRRDPEIAGDRGISGVLEELAGQWRDHLAGALDAFYTAGPLPPDMYLLGGGANIPEIKEALSASDLLGKFSHLSSPRVRVIQAEKAYEGNTFGGALSGPEDVGLSSLLWYSLHHKPLF